ncbi:response regulator [Pelagibius sp. Alg239-R121]|uniref:response regulator n=1 Tax=Pelagibius sp. Alg239-R121 TaxID=2993448 RepID=UPI0024A6DE1A|nr:response regulator [Pelagibius sp. Alg239-R121]
MDEPAHILVVDDDKRLRELLRKYLSDQNFRVTTAGDAGDARQKLSAFTFDIIVLDIMMPGENGLELTSWLRSSNKVPILLLSAMGESEHRISGLESGADDYLSKPFEPRELVLRLNAILRRVESTAPPVSGEINFGGFCFDLAREELRQNDEYIRLTAAEASLLKALARSPGVPISREALTSESPINANSRTIDVQVTRLRRKIETDPKYPRYLQTVRGTGYVLIPD